MASDQSESNTTVSHAAAQRRFEIAVDGERAGYAEYLDHDGQRIFYHTEVDERFSGRGLAGTLVSRALDETRGAGLRIVAVCPYVAAYVKKHHEWDEVLDPATPETLRALDAEVP